ncbi:NAD(P)/FAD-dependent oxidoreductase [Caldalkalibacillus thermarum TA2.A1]|uniref:NAD(P)/FAD-dependent oxidoreductase n=1 Tax=Caldalkalibacillus thermarum (strain TA2.A1) TaxID=986075 RepID=A0A8X8IBV1_CALTT|nr:NAD(P)/FAD-dependent oxidoreductase [Caldalkalibacillus thermarum TA2.A1]
MQTGYEIVIVGGGTAGISVAARLKKKIPHGKIAIIDPAHKHYYQPLWTLVGGGIYPKEASVKDQLSLIPSGVKYIQEVVTEIDPDRQLVLTNEDSQISYDYLIVCPGLSINWDGVKGLKEAIGKDGVVTIYFYDFVDKTWEAIRNFKGGNAVFTFPNTPIKCGGAPQKIMYLAEEHFRRAGIRSKCSVKFYTAKPDLFDVAKYRQTLESIVRERGIYVYFERHLIEIKAGTKEAVFEHLITKETETVPYDLLHVTPPMGPVAFLKNSAIVDQAGWVDVDPHTLQHKKYETIFALGDAANLPTSKTGAAIRKQVPVVVHNLLALKQGRELTAKYNGYTSCPIVTGRGKLIMAEFDYAKQPQETFPFDQSKERYSMFLVKKHVLPRLYWYGMLKGRA